MTRRLVVALLSLAVVLIVPALRSGAAATPPTMTVADGYDVAPNTLDSTFSERLGDASANVTTARSRASATGRVSAVPAVFVAADSEGGILSRVKAAARGDRGAIGREPVIGGEAANYGDDELAQFAFQHSGQDYANGEVRPSLDEIQSTISNGVRTRLPNQNAIRIQTPSVRVTINEDQPWKSTAYYR